MIIEVNQLKTLHELIISLLNNSLAVISNAEYQHRVWLKAEGPEVDSYEDSYDHFIKYSSAIFELPLAPKYLGKPNYNRLKELCNTLEAYNIKIIRNPYYECYPCCQILTNESLKEILNDPEWHVIQQTAKVLYDDLTIKEQLLLKILNSQEQL